MRRETWKVREMEGRDKDRVHPPLGQRRARPAARTASLASGRVEQAADADASVDHESAKTARTPRRPPLQDVVEDAVDSEESAEEKLCTRREPERERGDRRSTEPETPLVEARH